MRTFVVILACCGFSWSDARTPFSGKRSTQRRPSSTEGIANLLFSERRPQRTPSLYPYERRNALSRIRGGEVRGPVKKMSKEKFHRFLRLAGGAGPKTLEEQNELKDMINEPGFEEELTKVFEHMESSKIIHSEIDKALKDPAVMTKVQKLMNQEGLDPEGNKVEGMALVKSVVKGMVSLLPAKRKELFENALEEPGCEERLARATTLEEFAN
mmetsp:Transcript_79815/g.125899  ORF Transcript_79815/g.125899 Transcript_79815/m.125899 type:complete len:213 (-) Transcript_79815:48-686(-)